MAAVALMAACGGGGGDIAAIGPGETRGGSSFANVYSTVTKASPKQNQRNVLGAIELNVDSNVSADLPTGSPPARRSIADLVREPTPFVGREAATTTSAL